MEPHILCCFDLFVVGWVAYTRLLLVRPLLHLIMTHQVYLLRITSYVVEVLSIRGVVPFVQSCYCYLEFFLYLFVLRRRNTLALQRKIGIVHHEKLLTSLILPASKSGNFKPPLPSLDGRVKNRV